MKPGSMVSALGKKAARQAPSLAPRLSSSFIRETLQRAIDGIGPLPPVTRSADSATESSGGRADKAVKQVIESHVRYAGAQGFVTNLGGFVAAAVAIPANITGLALIQCRMIAAIVHLRGYDLHDPRVRNAILVCMLGEDTVNGMVRRGKLPAPPMALATAPAHSPELDQRIGTEVAAELLAKVVGKRAAVVVGRRIPVLGGVVGLSADAWQTWQIGRYAGREFLPRARR